MSDRTSRGDRLSHELRTPIHAILGNVELLLDGTAGPLSGDARACIGEIQAAGNDLLRQTRVLLPWSEVERRARHASFLRFDLLDLLRQVSAQEFGRDIQVRPDNASLVVRGDQAWLKTLLIQVVELGSDGCAPAMAPLPVATLETQSHLAALRFVWSTFSPDQVSGAKLALIEAVCDLHGMLSGWISGGLCLYWPSAFAGPVQVARDASGQQLVVGVQSSGG